MQMPATTKTSRNTEQEPNTEAVTSDYDDQGLAARLRIALATLRAWRCRSPHLLPPGVKVGRNWLYNKIEVEEWLCQKRLGHTSESKPPALELRPGSSKRRGKPTKVEADEARALGLTVPALRAQKAGGQTK